jgi:peptidoglycan/LPS O-acetylase OafA/YrhL
MTPSTTTSGPSDTALSASSVTVRDQRTVDVRYGFGRRRRYHEVDILRIIAALGVVGFHFLFRSSTTSPVLAHTGFSDPGGIFHYGNIGVPLFFVISGFVILNSAWNRSPIKFLSSRVGRLYPTFWVACTLTALVIAVAPGDRFTVSFDKWLANLSMFSESYGVDYVDGVYWTLAIELAFYVLMLAFIKVGLSTNRVIAFCVGWLAISVLHAYTPAPDWLVIILVPSWACYFVAGMLFALVARDGWRWKYVLPLAAAYACCVRWAVHYFNVLSDTYDVNYEPIVIGVAVTAIFGIFAAICSGVEFPGARKLAVLGGLTYPLYLIHENIGFIAINVLHGQLGLNRFVVLALVLALLVALAWALHVAVENRFARPLAQILTRVWESIRDRLRTRMPIMLRD